MLVLPDSVFDGVVGAFYPAAHVDAVNAAIAYLGRDRPHCRVYNTANISINNNSRTALTFDSERVDIGGMHSTVSNTGRITIPSGEGGFYLLSASIEWAANATGQRNIEIRLNGSTLIGVQNHPTTAALNHEQSVTTLYQLAAGDYVECTVFQTSGIAINVSNAANYSPEFSAIWMCS